MEKLIAIINTENKTVGLATTVAKAHQLRHSITTGQPLKTPREAQDFLAAVMQQAVITSDHATFTNCLYQLRDLFKINSH